ILTCFFIAVQLIVGQGVTHNRLFLRKCARWSTIGVFPIRMGMTTSSGTSSGEPCARPALHPAPIFGARLFQALPCTAGVDAGGESVRTYSEAGPVSQ